MPKLLLLLLTVLVVGEASAASNYIICYYASWAATRPGNGKFVPEDIDPNLCTHINYAFVGLNNDGSLQILDKEVDINRGGLKTVSSLKEKNPSLKVLLSVGGAAADLSVFAAIAGDSGKLATLAKSALDLFDTYNYDGLDVDWEYPFDKPAFIKLLSYLKDVFKPKGYLLTAAVNSIPGEVGGYDIPGMSKVLDIINVMTYDFHSPWAGVAAENSPLYGGASESQWQRENRNSDAAIRYWIDGGAAPQQVAIGIAFYGHSFVLSNPARHDIGDTTTSPGAPGNYTNNLGSLGYNEICEFHPDGKVVFLDDMKVPYLYDGSFWIGFDNEESVAAKVKYAKEMKLAGVFIWSIETDDMHGYCGEKNGLLKAINGAMKK